jgi:hypothetical protein
MTALRAALLREIHTLPPSEIAASPLIAEPALSAVGIIAIPLYPTPTTVGAVFFLIMASILEPV